MRTKATIVGATLVIAAAILSCRDSSAPETGAEPQAEPSIHVTAVALNKGSLPQEYLLFGTIAPLLNSTRAYTLAFEATVQRLHVSAGQHVDTRAPLFDYHTSLATAVAAESATDLEKELAQRLAQVLARQADGLATREELIQAQGQLRRAQQQVGAMRGAGQLTVNKSVRALHSGVVAAVGARVGALVPAGAPIVTVTEDESIGAQVWAEPSQAKAITPGMPVTVQSLAAHQRVVVRGHVLRSDERVDPTTGMVRISVVLDDPSRLLLGQAVRAQVAVDAPQGFIVPRASVVARDGEFLVFSVKDGHAQTHKVEVVVDAGERVLIRGAKLTDKLLVITRGAYQAEDGMRLEINP